MPQGYATINVILATADALQEYKLDKKMEYFAIINYRDRNKEKKKGRERKE